MCLGTNILLTKDFDGIVLINQLVGIDILRTTADNVWLQVGSGEDWHKFVLFTTENNLFGIQNLAFIPGTVGAAPIQNIGVIFFFVSILFLSDLYLFLTYASLHTFAAVFSG
jgi:UDP-N-acetylenolpyruvoylglucosamine reductase